MIKRIILVLLLLLMVTMPGMAQTYTSQYPTAHSDTYVKATTTYSASYQPWFSTDPALSLIGTNVDRAWASTTAGSAFQRFHIDLGEAKIIRRIYYENNHRSGTLHTAYGVENFTFWGSNTGAGTFDDLVYANDEGWTELTISTNVMIEHINVNQADPQYITVTNSTAYRYYAFKIVDNFFGGGSYIGIRHIELQTEDGYPPAGITWNTKEISKWNTATITKWNGME